VPRGAIKGHKVSQQTREKIRLSHLGKSNGPMSKIVKSKISRANRGKKRTIQFKKKMSLLAKKKYGPGNPHWKGGKFTRRDGYVCLRIEGKYYLEHRIIWENHFNKSLPPGWVIHHLNGIRNDNRINNLVALPKKGNRKHHGFLVMQAQAKRIQELEKKIKNLKGKLCLL
jgi:hypothetical protein